MNQTSLTLSEEARTELTIILNTSPIPYLRERACALLKVADGLSCLEVGAHHLLKRRDRHSVSDWVNRYKALGISGLTHKTGKGRRPAFFPPQ